MIIFKRKVKRFNNKVSELDKNLFFYYQKIIFFKYSGIIKINWNIVNWSELKPKIIDSSPDIFKAINSSTKIKAHCLLEK